MRHSIGLRVVLGVGSVLAGVAPRAGAAMILFFDPAQVAENVSSGVTSDTIRCDGYLFTYTRDKLFTGGLGGGPIGRGERVHWPDGVEAQAVTTPPPGVTDYKARITIRRVDGDAFDLTAFTVRLLANTAGAGGAIEVMPQRNGEDGFSDPLTFDATGVAGNSFSYNESTPSYLGNTAPLKGFDTYSLGLYVDFAMTGLIVEGAPVPEPSVLAGAALGGALIRRRRGRRSGAGH